MKEEKEKGEGVEGGERGIYEMKKSNSKNRRNILTAGGIDERILIRGSSRRMRRRNRWKRKINSNNRNRMNRSRSNTRWTNEKRNGRRRNKRERRRGQLESWTN